MVCLPSLVPGLALRLHGLATVTRRDSVRGPHYAPEGELW